MGNERALRGFTIEGIGGEIRIDEIRDHSRVRINVISDAESSTILLDPDGWRALKDLHYEITVNDVEEE